MTYSMNWPYRICFLLFLVVAGMAVVACGVDLAGLSGDQPWTEDASDVERWAGLVVGVVGIPFCLTALIHGRLTLENGELTFLRMGLICTTRSIRLDQVRRWGWGIVRSRRQRKRMLLLEMEDGGTVSTNLSMYVTPQEILSRLEQESGVAPTETRRTLLGLALEDDA